MTARPKITNCGPGVHPTPDPLKQTGAVTVHQIRDYPDGLRVAVAHRSRESGRVRNVAMAWNARRGYVVGFVRRDIYTPADLSALVRQARATRLAG